MTSKDGKIYPLTIKQELFISEYLIDGNATRAYKTAYNTENMKESTIYRNAHELLKHNNKVRTRLNEINEAKRLDLVVTSESVTKKLYEVIDAATNDNAWSSVVSALQLQAKINGLLIDRTSMTIQGQSPEQWITDYKARLSQGITITQDDDKPIQ
jgi:hypothetical protein